MTKTFESNRTGTGTAEWAEVTENICVGCPNNCRYCYAAAKAAQYGLRERDGWVTEAFTKRAQMTSYATKDGVIMFPSSHDITPFNVDAYIRIAKLMVQQKNQLLIVSKPRLKCILPILDHLSPWKSQILFRFTIGSMDTNVIQFWEPGATLPAERIACLQASKAAGFRTSVSCEPMLGGPEHACAVIEASKAAVTDTIWVGKMNKLRTRIAVDFEAEILAIEHAQRDQEILRLVALYQDAPIIKWKDSILEVIARAKATTC